MDGWASIEVSPRIAFDTQATSDAAQRLHAAVDRPNVFIKIPGTPEGLPAIEESIARGIPVNVTLLSHGPSAHIGVNRDRAAAPDGEALGAKDRNELSKQSRLAATDSTSQ